MSSSWPGQRGNAAYIADRGGCLDFVRSGGRRDAVNTTPPVGDPWVSRVTSSPAYRTVSGVTLMLNAGDEARLFVGDTGGLMNDVVQAARRGHATSLMAAMCFGTALLYIPRHVLVEVQRDLPIYCQRPKHAVDRDAAMKMWQMAYAPFIRVVDVPSSWGSGDARVQAVAARHDTDLPTAQLAVALADSYMLARDGDLTEHFGKHEHLELLHAAANRGEMVHLRQAGSLPVVLAKAVAYEAYKLVRRMPTVAQLGVVMAASTLGLLWQQSGRAAKDLERIGSVAGRVVQKVGPPLAQLQERLLAGEAVWAEHVVSGAKRNEKVSWLSSHVGSYL